MGTTSKAAGLPGMESVTGKTKVAQSAPPPCSGPNVHTTLQSGAEAANHVLASRLPGQGIPASTGQQTAEDSSLGQQQSKPSEQALQSKAPTASAMHGQAASGAAPANSHADTVMEEAAQEKLADTTPWTSTSLAGGLMGNMKHLEAVSQQLAFLPMID